MSGDYEGSAGAGGGGAAAAAAHAAPTGKRAFETKLIPGPEEYSAAVTFLGSPEGTGEDGLGTAPDLDRALRAFWEEEKVRAAALQSAPSSEASEVFKYANDLPLARIKRIMKSDEDVRMISAEAPVLFAKACELFISDLSMRAWCYTTEDKGKRRTLTREDVCTAVQQTDIFDFLVEVLLPGEGRGGGAKPGAKRPVALRAYRFTLTAYHLPPPPPPQPDPNPNMF